MTDGIQIQVSGLTEIQEQLRQLPGNISRSRIHRTQTDQGVYLTLKKGRGRSDPKDAFYGRWVESGYRKGRTQVPGQFIVQNAFNAKKNEAVAVIVSTAEAKIEQLTRNIGH